MRLVRCKDYHRPRARTDPGTLAVLPARKSRCPGWAADEILQRLLIEGALPDPHGAADIHGRPKRVWNAVAGTVFVGVSTNEQDEAYNCYPEVPATSLHSVLAKRAERTIAELMQAEGGE